MKQDLRTHIKGYFGDMVNKANMFKRCMMVLASCVFISGGISLFSLSGFGVDPYTSFMFNMADVLNVQYELLQTGTNLFVVLIVMLFAHRGLVGIGTIFNATIIGFIIGFITDFFVYVPKELTESLLFTVPILLVGIVTTCLGCSLFFTADIGVGAYDTIGFIMERRMKIKYKWARVSTDVVCVSIGLICSGGLVYIVSGDLFNIPNVGLGTVISALSMGPVISFFNAKVSSKILAHDFSVKRKNTVA